MNPSVSYVCPRCDHRLVPVHAVRGTRREVIALACPEPYCDHVQRLPLQPAGSFEKPVGAAAFPLRKAN